MEEAEAHLYSDSQKYISEFNNLLYANEIKNADEQCRTIVDVMEEYLICNAFINGASDEINAKNDKLHGITL